MARSALMERLMQPAKWLFRKELIPLDDLLDDLAGPGLKVISKKLGVDFSEMPAAQLRPMVVAMIQTGGGLMVDANGKIYFDADSMDTAVFEKMLKKLRLPKWLERNLTIHVNNSHASAANTLIEGRGLTEELPFASINSAVAYVCENYNLGNFNATIRINDGVYEELITLPDYTSMTGRLILQPKTMDATRRRVVIKNPGGGAASNIYVTGNKDYTLQHLDIQNLLNMALLTNTVYPACINASGTGLVRVMGCRLNFSLAGGSLPEGSSIQMKMIASGGGGTVRIQKDDLLATVINAPEHQTAGCILRMFHGSGGSVYLLNDRTGGDTMKVLCKGAYSIVASVDNKGDITVGGAGTHKFSVEAPTGETVTGKRYDAATGGSINTGNGGPDYFPGSINGTVDANTYCWYK